MAIDAPPWNCEVDGHEFEERGEYDPDTNCYPWMECTYCEKTKDWEPPSYPEDDL